MAAECEILTAPFGCVEIWRNAGKLHRVVLAPVSAMPPRLEALCEPAMDGLRDEIARYLQNPHHRLLWDALPPGTRFQRRVWEALQAIPAGETRTYGQLAGTLGSGARAVAGACRANPWALIIPCHRVVGAKSDGGYCGHVDGPYLAIKRWLLMREGGIGSDGFE